METSFDQLVEEAETVSVEGWDFSWLDGRATEQRPSWEYQRLLGAKLAAAAAALDIQTGGGEVVAGVGAQHFPPTMVATEGWPPNVAKATALLHPIGVVVVADREEPPLPFADGAFDLGPAATQPPVAGARSPAYSLRGAPTSHSTSASARTSRSASTFSDR